MLSGRRLFQPQLIRPAGSDKLRPALVRNFWGRPFSLGRSFQTGSGCGDLLFRKSAGSSRASKISLSAGSGKSLLFSDPKAPRPRYFRLFLISQSGPFCGAPGGKRGPYAGGEKLFGRMIRAWLKSRISVFKLRKRLTTREDRQFYV